MHWRFNEPLVETPEHVLHKVGCPKIETEELLEHPAGFETERRAAPSSCGICRPDVVLKFGEITSSLPLEETDERLR